MKHFFTLTCLFIYCAASAQREADLKVAITAPSNPFEVDTMETFDLEIEIANMGPDNITEDDSLFFYMTMNGEPVLFPPQGDYQVYQANLAAGGTFAFNKPFIFNSSFEGSEVDLCVIILPGNAANVISDSQQTDNKSCISIQIGEQPGVGLNESDLVRTRVVPNPAVGQVQIVCDEPVASLTVSDYSGKVLLYSEDGSKLVDCSSWPEGMYYLGIETHDGAVVEKVVVTK